MAFGDTYDKYAMTEQSLVQAAKDCGISQESFFSLVSDMTEKISTTVPSLIQKHQEKFGEHEIYKKLNNVISQSCETLNLLCVISNPKP